LVMEDLLEYLLDTFFKKRHCRLAATPSRNLLLCMVLNG
jgi:hypothetical protein